MRIDDATYWAVKRAAGPLSTADARRLDAWLAGDALRRGALARAEAGHALIDRALAVGPLEPGAVPEPRPAGRWSRRGVVGAGAAALAAGAAALFVALPSDRLDTGVGEIRRVRLADRSTVVLNTQSRVRVDLEPGERRLSLDRGEAWFQVAHDRRRPFVVAASDLRVRAVGTAFSMRRLTNGTDVLVTDGTVEVWRTGGDRRRIAISAGHRAFVADAGVAIVPVAASGTIERTLAWRAGGLSLAGETLDYAVGEFNRYNALQLQIDDPVLGRAPIVGYFRVDDPIAFARSVAMVQGADVHRDGQVLHLVPRRS